MASTYLTRTVSSGADLTKWTWSCWVKRTDLVGGGNNYQRLISNEVSGNTKSWYIRFQNSTQFHAWSNNGAFEFTTNANYRDINGWYHLVVKYDSTQSTEADRFKVYVNGEQPSMANIHYPTLNETVNFMNTGNYVDIGYYRQGSSEYFYGLMSHMHFTAGYAYDASTFGSTDATTGEWKINTSPSVTYGSLGFFILKDGNSVTDQSGNSNNFTVGGGTLTKTEDNPSNVFCVMNPLDFGIGSNNATLSLGNTKAISGNNNWRHSHGTLGVTSGKYYFEGKQGLTSDGGTGVVFGFCDQMYDTTDDPNSGTPNAKFYGRQGTTFYTPSGKTDNFFPNTSGGDILMVALDLDNNKIWFGTNGTWHNTNGSAGNTSYSSTTLNSSYPDATSVTIDTSNAGVYMPILGSYNDGYIEANFGNGYFGTTAVASAGTNASNNGIFEYDVPTGYTALSTKGLNL